MLQINFLIAVLVCAVALREIGVARMRELTLGGILAERRRTRQRLPFRAHAWASASLGWTVYALWFAFH